MVPGQSRLCTSPIARRENLASRARSTDRHWEYRLAFRIVAGLKDPKSSAPSARIPLANLCIDPDSAERWMPLPSLSGNLPARRREQRLLTEESALRRWLPTPCTCRYRLLL